MGDVVDLNHYRIMRAIEKQTDQAIPYSYPEWLGILGVPFEMVELPSDSEPK